MKKQRLSSPAVRLAVALSSAAVLSACVTPPPRTIVVAAGPIAPEPVYVYPAKGQSPQQTDRDKYECHLWAVQDTGVDPSRSGEPAYQRVVVEPSTPPGSATAAGAIGGAILGSILAGPRNAGAGLVLGAATGAVVGTAAQADANAQAQNNARVTQAQLNAQAAAGQARADSYHRAFSACLMARGYSVT